MNIQKPKDGVIAIDNGGFSTCVVTSSTMLKFPSVKGECRRRNLISTHGKYDYVVELNGKKFMCGTLALNDCRFPLQMHTDSKQNIFYDLSILIACHQFGYDENYVVTSVPIFMHSDKEKNGIRDRLLGDHRLIINGFTKYFKIADLRVAPETVSAFWVTEPQGKVRWVDFGSRTTGYGSTLNDGENMRYLDSESGTFTKKGLDLTSPDDYETLVDWVAGRLTGIWEQDDQVILIGGGSLNEVIVSHFKTYFPNSTVHDNPQMANAKGMYLLGRSVYDRA